MKFILILFLAVPLSAQVPDGPKPQNWTVFSIAAAADVAASVYDTHITLEGINSGHGCYEANSGWVGRYPTARGLYSKNLGITGGLIGLGILFKKLRIPVAPYAAMGVDTAKHIRGGIRWHTFRNGACL